MFVIYFYSKWVCLAQAFAKISISINYTSNYSNRLRKTDLHNWGTTLSYNVNLKESFAFFFPCSYRQNLIIGLSPTIFSVTLAIPGKIGWNIELTARDQDNRWNNLQLKNWRSWHVGTKIFYFIKIWRKSLLLVK